MTENLSPEKLNALRQRWEQDRSSRIFLQLAEAYRRHQRFPEAIQVLEEGLKHHPTSLAGRVALGKCRFDIGQYDLSRQDLEKVVAQDPTQMVAYKLLVRAHLKQQSPDEAQERLDRYALLNAQDPEIEELQGQIAGLRSASAKTQAPGPIPAPGVAGPTPKQIFDLSPGGTALPDLAKLPVRPLQTGGGTGAGSPGVARPTAQASGRPPEVGLGPSAQGVEPQLDLSPQEPTWSESPAQSPIPDPPQVEPPLLEMAEMAEMTEMAEMVERVEAEPPGHVAVPEPPVAAPAAVVSPPSIVEGLPTAGSELAPQGPLAPSQPPLAAPLSEEVISESPPQATSAGTAGEAPVPDLTAPGSPLVGPAEPALAAHPPVSEVPAVDGPVAAAGPQDALSAGEAGTPVLEAPSGATVPTETPAPPGPETGSTLPPVFQIKAGGAGRQVQEVDRDTETATLGEIYLRQGHTTEAQRIFEQVLKRDPSNVVAGEGLLRIAERKKEFPDAATLLIDAPQGGLTERKIFLLNNYLARLREGPKANVP